MKSIITGAKILITGGTGTFGNAFLDKCIAENAEEVRIFSRDEKKQYDMAQRYRKYKNVKFFLGDIRDKSTIDVAMKGIDYVFHAAAMKQVPSCECFPMEAVKTNIIGSNNLLNSAIEHGVKKVVCLSTDKAVYPTSAMGMTKAYMEKLALGKSQEQDGTAICITRFGNLIASRGSAVPLFMEQVQNGLPITITEPNMTRFIMTVAEATDLVEEAFENGGNGEIFVKKSKACSTADLASAVCRYLKLSDDYPIEVIGARAGEKMHEALLTEEEAEYTVGYNDYMISSRQFKNSKAKISPVYKSDLAEQMSVDEIVELMNKIFTEGDCK